MKETTSTNYARRLKEETRNEREERTSQLNSRMRLRKRQLQKENCLQLGKKQKEIEVETTEHLRKYEK